MAKRQRGSTARPGQRPSTSRPPARPATARPAAPARPTTLTDDELERAAVLEAQVVAEENAAASSLARGRERRRAAAVEDVPRTRSRAGGALAAIAEAEYGIVRHDLRRIAAVFALIFGLLIASFIVIQALGIAQAPTAV
jgi:hypothetical protein